MGIASSPGTRIIRVLDRLGINEAHFFSSVSADWGSLVSDHADRMRSLAVVSPYLSAGIPDGLRHFRKPLQIIAGDTGTAAVRAQDIADRAACCDLVLLENYAGEIWSDIASERPEEISCHLSDFLSGVAKDAPGAPLALSPTTGEVDAVRYRVEGKGPPLVLLPLALAASQWEPLMPWLRERFTLITLGGAHLGAVASLEARVAGGYGDLVLGAFRHASPLPGEAILEVGCGSGAISRLIANETKGANPILATDLSPYLIAEAEQIARSAGLSDVIRFEVSDALDLPMQDDSTDICVCCTVLEESDAERMLSELARVTRPGGRIVVIVRALDAEWQVDLPVDEALRKRLNCTGPTISSGASEGGCANAGLYVLINRAGLETLSAGPRFARYSSGERLRGVLDRLASKLEREELVEFRRSVAETKGDLVVSEPFHCAVARKT